MLIKSVLHLNASTSSPAQTNKQYRKINESNTDLVEVSERIEDSISHCVSRSTFNNQTYKLNKRRDLTVDVWINPFSRAMNPSSLDEYLNDLS